jgi:hypothetical protein
MSNLAEFLLSQTVLIPLIIGVVRFGKTDESYHPFLLLLLMAFTAEVISFFCKIALKSSPEITINLYSLIECMILLYQFHVWGFLRARKKAFYALAGGFGMVWIVENLVFGKIEEFTYFFSASYFLAVVLLSINQINQMIIQGTQHLLKNAKFILCLAFIIFFLYEIIYDAAYFVSYDHYVAAATKILAMFNYMNAFTNLLYGVAVLLIPKKKNDLYFNRYFE